MVLLTSTPFAVNSLETLDDDVLSDITGQEGITIDKSYRQSIEEFKYIDGDGDGSSGPGEISIKYLTIGDFSPGAYFINPPTPNGPVQEVQIVGQTIDATENGVLMFHGNIGGEGAEVNNFLGNIGLLPRTMGFSSNTIALNTVTDCFGVPPGNPCPETPSDPITNYGVTAEAATLRGGGNGIDIRMDGIYIGKADGSGQGNIGTLTVLNGATYMGSAAIYTLIDKYGIAGGKAGLLASTPGNLSQAAQFMNNSANKHIRRESLYSSKANGTGLHVQTENSNGIGGNIVYYTDTDGAGGNQIGVYGMGVFRIATADELGDNQDLATGTYIRPGYTEYDLDIEDGKVVFSNMIKSNSQTFNQVFIGDVVSATDPTNPTGIIGDFAILGNRWEGSQSIYAH